MKRSMVKSLLFVLVLLTSAAAVKPCAGEGPVYTSATAGNVFQEMGPQPDWACAGAQASGPYARQLAWCEVGVKRVGGMLFGPAEPLWGGNYHGIGASVSGWIPPIVAGNASASGWFESNGPFTIEAKGASVILKASGYSASSNILGIRVTDGDSVVYYDVRVIWGWTPGTGSYFQQIDSVGNWPYTWNVQQSFYNLSATHGEIYKTFYPVGLAKAAFYVSNNVTVVPIANGQVGSNAAQADYISGDVIEPSIPSVPAFSEWGLFALVLALAVVGAIVILRRRMDEQCQNLVSRL